MSPRHQVLLVVAGTAFIFGFAVAAVLVSVAGN